MIDETDEYFEDDETFTGCLEFAGVMLAMAGACLVMTVVLLGKALWHFCCGEWG